MAKDKKDKSTYPDGRIIIGVIKIIIKCLKSLLMFDVIKASIGYAKMIRFSTIINEERLRRIEASNNLLSISIEFPIS